MITAETLQRFIEENETDQVIQQLAKMSENERAALHDASLAAMTNIWYEASKTMKSITDEQKGKYVTYAEQRKHAIKAYYRTTAVKLVDSAQATVMYCSDFPKLKKAGFKGLPSPTSACKILRQRNPNWLQKWCAWALDIAPGIHWQTVVTLENEGLVTIEHDAEYYQSIALGLTMVPDMVEYVENHPTLRENFSEFLTASTTFRAMASPFTLSMEVAKKKFRKHHAFSETVPTGVDHYANNLVHQAQHQVNTQHAPEEHPRRWLSCLNNLTARGIIDRRELINLSFQSLSTAAETPEKQVNAFELKESVSAFLCSLNNSLCPEKGEFLLQYMSLLGAANKNVSEHALKALIELPAESLPISDICYALPLTFRHKDKVPAELTLQLLIKMLDYAEVEAKRNSSTESISLITEALIEAFNHKSKAIHKEVLKLIETRGLVSEESPAAKLEQHLDLLEGTIRIAAKKLLKAQTPAVTEKNVTGQTQLAGGDASELVQEKQQPVLVDLMGLDETFLSLAAIPQLIEASKANTPLTLVERTLATVDLVSMESPKLYPSQAIQPITSVDDLIFLASAALTSNTSIEKAELLLDGIARLWKERPHNFEQKIETINATMKGPHGYWWDQGESPLGLVCQIWLQGRNVSSIRFRLRPSLLSARCVGLASRISCGLVLPQLAAPTHAGGWIDPVILTERIVDYQKHGRLLDTSGNETIWDKHSEFTAWLVNAASNKYQADAPEFIQALLRMAPDGREAALDDAKKINGEFGKALRYALGEEQEKRSLLNKALRFAFGDGDIESFKQPELALAAFRSRHPRGTCLPLANWFESDLPDAVYPSAYTCEIKETRRWNQTGFLRARVADGPSSNSAATSDRFLSSTARPETYTTAMQNLLCPTIRMHRYISDTHLQDETSLIWLQNREPYLARLARTVLEYVDSNGSWWQPDFTNLLDPDLPLNENGSWWLALSLTAKHDDLRRLALDILIAAVEENRVDTRNLSQAMAALQKVSYQKWAKALREMARVSTLHALFCWQLLDDYLSEKKKETNLALLEVLLELKEEFGFALSSVAIGTLTQFEGAGKGAKIAKSLASTATQWTNSNALHDAAKQSLQSRISRVTRWQQSQYFRPKQAMKT